MSGSRPEGNALSLLGCGAGESGLIGSVLPSPRDSREERERRGCGEHVGWVALDIVARVLWRSLNTVPPGSTGSTNKAAESGAVPVKIQNPAVYHERK